MAERYVDPFLESLARQQAQSQPATSKNQNSGFFGDFVDAVQQGAYQSAAGDAEAVGQISDSDTFKSIGKALAKGANSQTDTMTGDAKQALSQHIFKDDPDSFTGVALDDGATNWRTWALQFGILGGQVAGTVATGFGAGTVVKLGAKQVIKSVAKKAITKEAQQLVAKNAVKEAIRNGALDDVRAALIAAPDKAAMNAVLNKATSRIGGIATTAVAGSMAAGMRAQQARDEYLGLGADTLNQNPEFQKAYWEIADNPENQGLDTATIHNTAKEMLAEKAATTAFFDKKALLSDLASGAYVPGAGGVIGRGAATASKMGRFGIGLAQEGATEAWQGGETQRAVNEAIKEWGDESRDPMANVVRTRWEEGTLGGVFGSMAKVAEGQHQAPTKPIVTVDNSPSTGNSNLDSALAQSNADEQSRYDTLTGHVDELSKPAYMRGGEISPELESAITQFRMDSLRQQQAQQRQDGIMQPFDNPVTGNPDEPAFLRSRSFNPTGRDVSGSPDVNPDTPVQQALARSVSEDQSVESQLAATIAKGDQGKTPQEDFVTGEIVWDNNRTPAPPSRQIGSGTTVTGQADEIIPESRGLPYNQVINMGGSAGDGINSNYIPPVTANRVTADQSLGQESTRDPRSPVAQSIAQAGTESDSIFGQLKSLRVTKKGKPFSSIKEAQLASRKTETPIALPTGGFGVVDKTELEQVQASQNQQLIATPQADVNDTNVADINQATDSAIKNVLGVKTEKQSNNDGSSTYRFSFNDGHASVLTHSDGTAHIMDVQIGDGETAGLRGKGVGTKLYEHIGNELAKDGVTLESTRWSKHRSAISPAALRVWEKLEKAGAARVVGHENARVLDRFSGVNEVRDIPIYEFTSAGKEASQATVKQIDANESTSTPVVAQNQENINDNGQATINQPADRAVGTPSPETVTAPVVAKESQPQPASNVEQISESYLKDVDLLKEHAGKWKYRYAVGANWQTANSKESAIERAQEAHQKAIANGDPLPTKDERYATSETEQTTQMEQRYGKMSIPELEKEHARLGGVVSDLQQTGKNEFNGNGGRRTSAATANEGARDAGLEKMRLESYIQTRKEREPVTGNNENAIDNAPEPATNKSEKTIQDHFNDLNKFHRGDLSFDEFKQASSDFLDNEEAVKAKLSSLTKPEILKRMGAMFNYNHKGDKKDVIVDAAYQSLAGQLRFAAHGDKDVITETVSFEEIQGKRARKTTAIKAREEISALTSEKYGIYQEKAKAATKKAEERFQKVKQQISDPQTLDDFETFLNYRSIDKLTPEQKARYEDLKAERNLDKRDQAAAAAKETKVVPTATGDIVKTKHTKEGHDLFVVKLADRVDRDAYTTINAKAKELGGYYSKFRGNGAVPGFQFRTEEQAKEFQQWLSNAGNQTTSVEDVKATTDITAEPEVTSDESSKKKQADKLRDRAASVREKAQAELNADRKSNTVKRAREAAYAVARAEADLRFANILDAIANGIEAGEIKYLRNMTAGTQLETLDTVLRRIVRSNKMSQAIRDDLIQKGYLRKGDDAELSWTDSAPIEVITQYAEMPGMDYWANILRDTAKNMQTTAGFKQAGVKIMNQVLMAINAENRMVTISDPDLIEKLKQFSKNHEVRDYLKDTMADYDRLVRMGITSPVELRAALRELHKVKQSLKTERPKRDPVKQKEEALKMRLLNNRNAFVDFFPTPDEHANDVIARAGIEPGMRVLEPSAGHGALAVAARDAGATVDAVELSNDLRDILTEKGFNLVGSDFMATEPAGEYDAVVMNPPFSNDMDIDHVKHAYAHLKPGGRLVAIVSSMSGERSNNKNKQFKEWLDSLGATEEMMPEGSFKNSMNPTSVRTKIIELQKPSDSKNVKNQPMGSRVTIHTPKGKPVEVQYQLVSAADLVASNEFDGRVNKSYPQELQPRDRTKASYQQQVNQIAANPEGSRLAGSPESDRGAPIVRDLVVESGNGRTIGIKQAYKQGTANEYRDYLIKHADEFGFTSDDVNMIDDPVLVRQRVSDLSPEERLDFVVDSNTDAKMANSATEDAKSDARYLDNGMMDLLNIPEGGDLLAASNERFLSAFATKLGSNSLNNYKDSSGRWNESFRKRVSNAIFAYGYDNDTLLKSATGDTSEAGKNLTSALMNNAASVAELRSMVPETAKAFVNYLAEGIDVMTSAKRNGQSIQEVVNQGDMLSGGVSHYGGAIAEMLSDASRSGKRLTEILNQITGMLNESAKSADQVDLLTGEPTQQVTAEEAINAAEKDFNKRKDQEQRVRPSQDLFGANTARIRDNNGSWTSVSRPVSTSETKSAGENRRLNIADSIKDGMDASDLVNWIANNSENESYREIAKRIAASIPSGIDVMVVKAGEKLRKEVPASMNISNGMYWTKGDQKTLILKDASFGEEHGLNEETALHELIHAATMRAIREGNKVKADKENPELSQAVSDLYALQKAVVKHLDETTDDIGLSKLMAASQVKELVAWGMTNKEFQGILQKIPYENKTAWNKFVSLVAKVLGLKKSDNNALGELIRITDKIVSAKDAYQVKFSKQSLERTPGEVAGKHMTKPEAELAAKSWLKQFSKDITVKVAKTDDEFKSMLEDHGYGDLLNADEVGNAAYIPDSKTLILNSSQIENPARLRQIMRHEILVHHGLRFVVGDDVYSKVINAIMTGYNNSPAIQKAMEQVLQNYPNADLFTQMEEVFAHYAEHRPIDKGALGRLWDRVVSMVKSALQKVGFIKKSENESEQDLDSVLKSIAEGMRNSRSEASTGDMTMMFSVENESDPFKPNKAEADNYRSQLERAIKSQRSGEIMIDIGKTPEVLRAVGAPELSLRISRDTIRKATNGVKHDVPMDVIERLPELLHDPVSVFDSKTHPGDSLVVLLDAADKSGRGIVSAIQLKIVGGKYLDINRIASVHGRPEAQVNQWVSDGLARYIKENHRSSLRTGLQLPLGSSIDGYDRSIITADDIRNKSKPLFSKTMTADDELMTKLGLGPKPNLAEKTKSQIDALKQTDRNTVKAWIKKVGRQANTQILDALAPIKYAEESAGSFDATNSAYVAARLSSGSASVMQATMLYGLPEWKDGVVQRKDGTTDKDSLLGIFSDLGSDLHNWLAWMAGHRAEILMAEGRENLLSAADITKLKLKGAGKEAKFNEAKKKWNKLNGAVLDMAQEAGLIKAEERANWESEWYIPFFRETDDGDVTAPFKKNGIANQSSGIKKLKGGTANVNDLLENIFTTTGKLIDASMKNMAAQKLVHNLADTDLISIIDKPNLMDLKAAFKNQGNKMTVRVDGEDHVIQVSDPDLFKAMTMIDMKVDRDPFRKLAMKAKHLITAGVTASPDFMLRNFLRDAASSWAINEDGFKPMIDSIRGVKKAWKMDDSSINMMFSGASFMGGNVRGNDPTAMATTVRKVLKRKGMSPEQINEYESSLITTGIKAKEVIGHYWEKYEQAGEAVENGSREAVYEAAIKAGKSHAQAAFEAKDLMDFSMLGSSKIMRYMVDVLPFFNARMQGLGKLGRAMAANPKQIAKRGGMIAAASLALLAMNWDDERYNDLPDWDKDMNWHFWFGDQHFRIPKPFEVGLMFGTLPERMVRAIGGKDSAGKFGEVVARNMLETFSINPIPQVVKPLTEVYFNYDMFRGAPVEDMSDLNVNPEARYDEKTSLLMRELGDMTGMSPKKLEHVVLGYTGTMGGYVMAMGDGLVRMMGDYGDAPAIQASQIPMLKSIYQGDGPAKSSQAMTDFYQLLDESNQIYATIRQYNKEGRTDDARELLDENRTKLAGRKSMSHAQKQFTALRNEITLIQRDRILNSDEKRQRIDKLLAQRNNMAAKLMQRFGTEL